MFGGFGDDIVSSEVRQMAVALTLVIVEAAPIAQVLIAMTAAPIAGMAALEIVAAETAVEETVEGISARNV